MPRPARLPSGLVLLWVLVGIDDAVAQPADIWRYFSVRDGLVESYIGAVSTATPGRVWITHGQVAEMSAFDGFAVRHFPSPGIDTRVEEAPGGQLWAMTVQAGRTELELLSGGAWKKFPLPDAAPRDPDLLVSAAGAQRFLPIAPGHVMYIGTSGLREFDAGLGHSRNLPVVGCSLGPVLSLARSVSGFWIAGERGLGRVRDLRPGAEAAACIPWGGTGSRTYNHFSNLFDAGDSVFASARDGGAKLLLRVTSVTTQLLARTAPGQDGISGWAAAADGSAWILREDRGAQHLSLRAPDGSETPAPQSKVLSGRITDVAVEPAGIAWIASSLGLARVAPPIWQPFGPHRVANQSITAIVENDRKELLFLGVHTLWVFSEGRWLERALPLPPMTSIGASNRMAVLTGGKLAIPMHPAVGHASLLVYDRSRDRFETLSIPGFDNCTFVAARNHRRAWAACQTAAGLQTLFSYDGARFDRAFDLPPTAISDWPRAIAELRDGSIWVGAFWPDSLFRYAHGGIEKVPLPPEASAMGISDIAELPDGRLWVGGRNLVLERNGSRWRVVEQAVETVRAIYPARDGTIWVAAGAGILQCRELGCVIHRSDEGLPEGVAWTILEDSQGRLLAGTTSGVRFRDPRADPDPPCVQMPTRLNVSRFAPGGEVRFVPAAVDRWNFTEPDQLLFSYRLDGGAWTPAEPLTVVALKEVTGGDHTLEIRAMDRNFNWSPAVVYPFQVLVPWYRQAAWIAVAFCASATLAFSLYLHLSRHHELHRAVATTAAKLKAEFEQHSRSQARFQQILDRAPALIYVKDLDGRYLISNQRHAETLGKPRAEIVGRTDEELFGPDHPTPFHGAESEARRRVVQTEVTDPQSERTYISLQFPLEDPAGVANAVCGILSDISQLKKFQGRAQAAERLETVGLLAGGVAHDFNNLLTVINGYSELVLNRLPAESPVRGAVKSIRNAGEHAAALTAQLLAFGRKQQIQPAVLKPESLIGDLAVMVRSLVPERIELVTRLAPELDNVRVDPAQFQQILINLVLNARDAMPGGGRLLVEVTNAQLTAADAEQEPDLRPGDYVLFTVSDSGAGMTPEVQARVFEPFFTTKEMGKGTGLGLATVYGMVKQSEGWIRLRSEAGRGTTFHVYLPAAAETETGPGTAQPKDLHGSGTVLVVEDQPEVRTLTAAALKEYGYTVHSAASGSEAASVFRDLGGAVQLLVTDVVMPGMKGPELADRLRSLSPELKVLFMSGHSDEPVAFAGVPTGNFRFLQKPFTPDLLASTVRDLLASN